MKIKEILTPGPKYVSPDATLVAAAENMKSGNMGILPICENDILIGTVTDRDITVRAVAEGRNPYTTKVRDVMSSKVIYCFGDQTIEDAAEMMAKSKIRRLPVLDDNNRLVGIISIGDLAARAHQSDLAGRTLAAVTAHG